MNVEPQEWLHTSSVLAVHVKVVLFQKKKRFSVQVDLVIIEEIKYETRINLNEARTWIYLKMDSGQDHRGLCTILR